MLSFVNLYMSTNCGNFSFCDGFGSIVSNTLDFFPWTKSRTKVNVDKENRINGEFSFHLFTFREEKFLVSLNEEIKLSSPCNKEKRSQKSVFFSLFSFIPTVEFFFFNWAIGLLTVGDLMAQIFWSLEPKNYPFLDVGPPKILKKKIVF